MLKKWRVTVCQTAWTMYEVEAEDQEQAEVMALEAHTCERDHDALEIGSGYDGDYYIDESEEVKENGRSEEVPGGDGEGKHQVGGRAGRE